MYVYIKWLYNLWNLNHRYTLNFANQSIYIENEIIVHESDNIRLLKKMLS